MYTEHPLAEILRAIADGKPVEFRIKQHNVNYREKSWEPFNPSFPEICFWLRGHEYRVKPKEPVKKWRWVVQYMLHKDFCVTDGHYASGEEYKEKYPMGVELKFIQKIDETMIEVME